MAYFASEGLEADDDRVEVLALPQVDRLEELLRRDTHLTGRLQEAVDVLHALERHRALLDLLHDARLHDVGELAEQGAVAQLLVDVVWVAGQVGGLAGQRVNPLHHFAGVLLVVLAHDLSTFGKFSLLSDLSSFYFI